VAFAQAEAAAVPGCPGELVRRAAKTSAEKMLRVLAMAAYSRIRLLPSA
jgi:hypothetical protein